MVEDSLVDCYTVTTVGWAAKAANTGYGSDSTFGETEDILAKVVYKEKLFKSPRDGERRVSTTQIFINPGYDINLGDKIIISSIEYEIDLLEPHSMFEDGDHKEAVLMVIG